MFSFKNGIRFLDKQFIPNAAPDKVTVKLPCHVITGRPIRVPGMKRAPGTVLLNGKIRLYPGSDYEINLEKETIAVAFDLTKTETLLLIFPRT